MRGRRPKRRKARERSPLSVWHVRGTRPSTLLLAFAELVALPHRSDRLGVVDVKVNLAEKFELLVGPYAPRIVGFINDYKLQIVKVKGEFVWHKHDDTDDFFLVLEGELTIQLRDRDVVLGPGELFVVPKGVEHCPKAEEETHVLLIEPRGTPNTGDAGGALTAVEREI